MSKFVNLSGLTKLLGKIKAIVDTKLGSIVVKKNNASDLVYNLKEGGRSITDTNEWDTWKDAKGNFIAFNSKGAYNNSPHSMISTPFGNILHYTPGGVIPLNSPFFSIFNHRTDGTNANMFSIDAGFNKDQPRRITIGDDKTEVHLADKIAKINSTDTNPGTIKFGSSIALTNYYMYDDSGLKITPKGFKLFNVGSYNKVFTSDEHIKCIGFQTYLLDLTGDNYNAGTYYGILHKKYTIQYGEMIIVPVPEDATPSATNLEAGQSNRGTINQFIHIKYKNFGNPVLELLDTTQTAGYDANSCWAIYLYGNKNKIALLSKKKYFLFVQDYMPGVDPAFSWDNDNITWNLVDSNTFGAFNSAIIVKK